MDDTSFNPQTALDTSDAVTSQTDEPRMPAIALMGEFSAGKTTLINFLLGEDLLPTRVTATQLPPVWMSHGERSAHYVDNEGNMHDLDFDDLHSVPVEGVQFIKIYCEADILQEMDLIDTPGISDPNIPDSYRAAVVDYVDAVIWCTHSTQAWRESERSVWATIPPALQANSILLATRSDKLSERDRGRVRQRLERETGAHFRNIIMFSATEAIRACMTEDEAGLLVSSGGAALVETLQAISSEIAQASGGEVTSRQSSAGGPDGSQESGMGEELAVLPHRVTPIRPARVERGATRIQRPATGLVAETSAELTEPFGETLDGSATAFDDADSQNAKVDELAAADVSEGMEPGLDYSEADDDLENSEDQSLHMDVDITDDDIGADQETPADDLMTGVLDLKKYEIARFKEPAVDAEPEDFGDTSDISDFVARAGHIADEELEFEAECPEEVASADAGDEDIYTVGQFSAKALWDEVLAENPVRNVKSIVAAIGQFMEMLDARGLVIARPVDAVDMADEDGDTSGWRMHG